MFSKTGIEFVHNFFQAYRIRCKPLCHKLHIPQTAFDILLFLSNNPKFNTAKDIVELRGLKANLVSVNVDRLVQDGYLERTPFPGDRRKTVLRCTSKAQPIIDRGRSLQAEFLEELFKNVDEASRNHFYGVVSLIADNVNQIMKESR